MKRIIIALISLSFVLACDSPAKEETKEDIDPIVVPEPGGWDSMKLDKSNKLVFANEGGEYTISVTNYTSWWISGGYNIKRDEDGTVTQDFISPASPNSLDADWFHAIVPDKGNSNEVIVTVDANSSGQIREAIIEMTAGDIFCSLLISQQ